MIKPTIGRVVYYHPAFESGSGSNERALAAIICHVHSDDMINLAVFSEPAADSLAGQRHKGKG
jgi:hypothetical protein